MDEPHCPSIRELLQWPHTKGGKGTPPPKGQSDHTFTVGEILSGHFWYTNFGSQSPPPPPLSLSNTSLPAMRLLQIVTALSTP